MKEICIVGLGGHSKVIRDIILSLNSYKIVAYLDDKFDCLEYREEAIYGPISSAKKLTSESDILFIVAIGNNVVRKRIIDEINLPSTKYAVLVHPSAIVSPSTSIGYGTVIMPGSVINANTIVGNHAIINTGAIVEHDNNIADFAHISPNATLTGTVRVGEGTHIGAGATVIPNTTIGSWSVVGAGATVTRDVLANKKVIGTPAKSVE